MLDGCPPIEYNRSVETWSCLPAVLHTNNNTMTDTKSTGIIKTLNPRMFGFITREGETKDLFFHEKDLVGILFGQLKEGMKVSFQVSQTPKGPNAVNVEVVA